MLDYNPFDHTSKLGKVNSNFDEYQYTKNNESKDALETSIEKPNFGFIYFFCIISALILVFRLFDLQIAQGAKHEYLAQDNRIRSRDISAPRGNIYDCDHNMLVKNIASFNLELFPADLPKDKDDREKIYQLILQISNINIEELKNKVSQKGLFSLEPIVLKENLDRDEALLLQVKYNNISGVIVAKHPAREYLTAPGLSHILGYIGKVSEEELKNQADLKSTDMTGKSGVEFEYDEKIRGKDGKEQLEVDSRGQIQRVLATDDPIAGNNITLNINLKLQQEMANQINNKLQELKLDKAAAIAMNPQDGSILGLVNFPFYDNNIFSKNNRAEEYQKLLDDKNLPMLNRAIAGVYPSGSVIKPVVASAGLQEGVIAPETTIYAPASISIGEWVFPDWKEHGYVDVRRALAVSSNVFFYAVGGGYDKIPGLGLNRLKKYFQEFGFGARTDIDLPGETTGLIPDAEWKKKTVKESWYIGDTYHLAIGQGGFLTTPLQLLNSISAIANGGKLYKPRLLAKETDDKGNLVKEYTSEIIRENFIDADNLQVVREGMRQCVTDGSGRQLQDLPVSSGAKTGTAQAAGTDLTHSWFTAFAPYENPQIALVVLVENGGEGNEVAEPIANEILKYYFSEAANTTKK